MAAIDKQSASGFIHGFRYNIRTLHNILENRFFSTQLPHQIIADRQLQILADVIIGRSLGLADPFPNFWKAIETHSSTCAYM